MSLITRCPACTTLFKVVPDQLRVSEGWVRCGQCDEVFDATAHLQGDGTAQVAPAAQPPSPDPTDLAQPIPETNLHIETAPEADAEPHLPSDLAPQPEQQLEQELASQLDWPQEPLAASYDALMDVRPGAAFESDTALHLDLPGDPSVQVLVEERAATELDDGPAPESMEVPPQPWFDLERADAAAILVEPNALPEPEMMVAPTFMQTARKAHRPWVRRSLMALVLLLGSGLIAQVVWRERDRLAANVPDLRPTLTAMCAALDCQINPLKQIDAVVIDSSSFVKIRGDIYRLNVTLKNMAPIDVAAPAVELTLTDLQDQPMIRHVLSAAELGAQQATLAAGGELTTAVPIHVKVTGGVTDRISGYRLLAFYP